jgi:hypothetical protein
LLTHPTADLLVKLGLGDMARAFAELRDNPSAARLGHAEWLALLLEREASELPTGCAMPSCVSARQSRISTGVPNAASTDRCSNGLSPATRSSGSWARRVPRAG